MGKPHSFPRERMGVSPSNGGTHNKAERRECLFMRDNYTSAPES
jgi:hypothetical protein